MTTIDEILAAMPEPSAEGDHEYLVIDPVKRAITVPEAEKIFGVTGDELADRKYFICPRIVGDGLDLASMFIRVNFRNANGEEDGYLVTDVAVSGDYVTFSWQLWPKVVAYKGAIMFGVCADLPNTPDRKMPDWNTTMASGDVLEGLDPVLGDVEAETSDVVTQLRAEITAGTAAVEACGAAQVDVVEAAGAAATAEAVAAIQAQGEATRSSIPADYTTLASTVDRLTRDRAAAIVCGAEGEAVQVQDASNDPLQGLRIFGKTEQHVTTGAQLLPIVEDATKTDRGLLQIVKDGICTVKGTASSTAAFNLTLYGSYYNTEPVFMLQPGTYTVKDCMIVSYDGSAQKKYENTTFTLTEALGITWVATRSYQPGEVVDETTRPMLNAGSTAKPWEFYSAGVATPTPETPQQLRSLAAPALAMYGRNIFCASEMGPTANKSLTVEDDGYTIVAVGGGDKAYTSSVLRIDVDALRGRTLIMTADGITNSNEAARGGVQLNVRRTSKTDYEAISSVSLSRSLYISDDITELHLAIYTNNTGAALSADNTVTVKGLRLNIDQRADWSKGVAPQVLTITTTGNLPGIPVTNGGNYIDANGQRWICDEVDLARGVYVQRVKAVALTAAPAFNETADQPGRFSWFCLTGEFKGGREVSLCNYAKWRAWGIGDGAADYGAASINQIYYSPAVAMTADEVNAKFAKMIEDGTPPTILGQLETPVETPLTDVELQAFRALHSNKPTTTVLNDAGAWMALEYAADPKTYIDNKLAALVAAKN